MSEETEQTAGDAAAEPGPMTESAAAALLQDWKEETDQETAPVESARVKSNEAQDAAAEAEAEAAGTEPAEEAPAEAETEEGEAEETAQAEEAVDDYVHGNAKTRLRDGTEITVAELKKRADEATEFRRRQAEFDAQKREFETKAAQVAQQEQLFTTTISQAINALQQTLPPEPDQKLLETDPIAFFQLEHQRNAKLAELNRLTAAKQHADQEAQAKQAEAFRDHLKQEQEQLYEKAPDLRDEGKRSAFYSEFLSAGKHYGFSQEEMNGVSDHRLMLLVKDAMAYRKLQGAKPKVAAKAAAAKPAGKPVAQPAARSAPTSEASARYKAQFQRFTKTRSIDDASALLADLE